MKRKLILLCAGLGTRLGFFSYRMPKHLISIKELSIVETHIRYAVEAEIQDIYIVVGYKSEQFKFLQDQYPQVTILFNEDFYDPGTYKSLFCAREFVHNAFINYGDIYFLENPYLQHYDKSTLFVDNQKTPYTNSIEKWSVIKSEHNTITSILEFDDPEAYTILGPAFIHEADTADLQKLFIQYGIEEFANQSWFVIIQWLLKNRTLEYYILDSFQMYNLNTIDDIKIFIAQFPHFLLELQKDPLYQFMNQEFSIELNNIEKIVPLFQGFTNKNYYFAFDKKSLSSHQSASEIETHICVKIKEEQVILSLLQEVNKNICVAHYFNEGKLLAYDNYFIAFKFLQDVLFLDTSNINLYFSPIIEKMKYIHSIQLDFEAEIITYLSFWEPIQILLEKTSDQIGVYFENINHNIQNMLQFQPLVETKQGIVLSHGDLYASNIYINQKQQAHFIDLEWVSLASPYLDLGVFCALNLNKNMEYITQISLLYFGSYDQHHLYQILYYAGLRRLYHCLEYFYKYVNTKSHYHLKYAIQFYHDFMFYKKEMEQIYANIEKN